MRYMKIVLVLLLTCLLVISCQPRRMDKDELAEQPVREVLNEYLLMWNTGNFDVMDDVIDSAHVVVEPAFPDKIVGKEGFRQWIESYRTAYSDFNLAFEKVIIKDDNVVISWTVTGTHDGPLGDLPPTGKKIQVAGLSLIRMVDGKIAEGWVYYDNLDASLQLGMKLVPPEM